MVKEPRLSPSDQMWCDNYSDHIAGGLLADRRRRCSRGALVKADTWVSIVATSGCGGCMLRLSGRAACSVAGETDSVGFGVPFSCALGEHNDITWLVAFTMQMVFFNARLVAIISISPSIVFGLTIAAILSFTEDGISALTASPIISRYCSKLSIFVISRAYTSLCLLSFHRHSFATLRFAVQSDNETDNAHLGLFAQEKTWPPTNWVMHCGTLVEDCQRVVCTAWSSCDVC